MGEAVQTRFNGKSDEELFNLYKKGNAQAFDVLLDKYQGPLLAYILRFIRDQAKAEDVLQDVFMKVIYKKESFTQDISFKAWLYTLSRNTAIDALRKIKRLREDNPDEQGDRFQDPSPDSPEDTFKDSQIQFFLDEALKKLPQEQRETFELKVTYDLTFEEIAHSMTCSVNTAKSRMRYAVDVLKDVFTKRGYLR